MSKPMPCPFCASDTISNERDVDGWPIFMCDNCGARGPCTEIVREKALELWNTRALPNGERR